MVSAANIILFIAFFYFINLGNGYFPQAILSLCLGVFLTIFSIIIEIIIRPIRIEVLSSGVTMFFRFAKTKSVSYSQIRRVSDGTSDIQDGSISVEGMIQRKVRPEILRAIETGYSKAEGRLPKR